MTLLTFISDVGANILNGITPAVFVGYLFYMMLGAFASWLMQRIDHAQEIKANGGWKLAVWVKDNWKRAALVVIAIFLAIVFMDKYTEEPPSNFIALTIGLTIDVIVDRVFKVVRCAVGGS